MISTRYGWFSDLSYIYEALFTTYCIHSHIHTYLLFIEYRVAAYNVSLKESLKLKVIVFKTLNYSFFQS